MKSFYGVNIIIESIYSVNIVMKSFYGVNIVIESIYGVDIVIKSFYGVNVVIESIYSVDDVNIINNLILMISVPITAVRCHHNANTINTIKIDFLRH